MIFSSLVNVQIGNHETVIFGCNDSCVYCLQDKQLVWKTHLDSKVVATPFIEMYAFGIVVCFSSKGKCYCLDLLSGQQLCKYEAKGEVFSSPILVENKIIFGCRDNNVYTVKTVIS